MCVVKLHSKNLVALFTFIGVWVSEDGNYDLLFALLVFECEGTFSGFVVLAGRGRLRGVVNLNGFVLHGNFAVGALHAVHDHDALALVCGVPQRLFLFKDEHAGFVIVQDRHAGARVLADQPIFCSLVVQLHVKVFVWLPGFVVQNLHSHFGLKLSALKADNIVNWKVVVFGNCVSVLGADSDLAGDLGFVYNLDAKGASSLTDRVMEAGESKLGVFLVIGHHVGEFVLSPQNGSLGNGLFLEVDSHSFTIVDSLDERWTVKFFL